MIIKINTKIYPLDAILNTCYTFIDRAYIFLDTNSKAQEISVFIKGKKKQPPKEQSELLRAEFMNELLHSALRFKISRNNKRIREFIISRALCSTLPAPDLFNETSSLNYQEDPLGISIPWEEKYGKKNKKKSVKSKV